MKVKRVTLDTNSRSATFANGTVVTAAAAAAVTQWTPGRGVDPDTQSIERQAIGPLLAELERLGVSVNETLWFNVGEGPAFDVVVALRGIRGRRRLMYVDVSGHIALIRPDALTRGRAGSTQTIFSLGRTVSPPPQRYASSELGTCFLAVLAFPTGDARRNADLEQRCAAVAARIFGRREEAARESPGSGPADPGEPPRAERRTRGGLPSGGPRQANGARGIRPSIADGTVTRGGPTAGRPGFTRAAPTRAAAPSRATPGTRGVAVPQSARAKPPVKRAARSTPAAATRGATRTRSLARKKGAAQSKVPVTSKRAARAAKAELNVMRRPNIDFHELVVAGASHPLVVRLSEAITAEELAQAFAVAVAAGKDTVKLSVTLSAPGFEVLPARELPLTVGRTFSNKREQVKFTLKAQEPAGGKPVKRDIRADIWLGNASIGGVTHWTTVVPKGFRGRAAASGESRSSPFEISNPGRECELVIRVQGKDDFGSPPYEVSLRSRIPKEPEFESRRVGTIDFSRKELATLLQRQFARFADTFPADGNKAELKAWRASLLDEIDTLGKWLWTKLPEALRTEYFRLADARHLPASILVHSDEMLIPWELIVPHRNGKVFPRLGVAHVMGRWRPALGLRPRPQQLTVSVATIANPKYGGESLVWSVLEAAALKAVDPAFQTLPSVTRADMARLLKRTDVQLVHFTGHGAYAKHADLSTLLLEGGDTVTAMNFVGSALLTKAHAIVYLNACEVGNSGVVMGQMGGFAAQCVENGCSGIVAPYWAVADESAGAFAKAFYEKLKSGRAIGEALQELRKEKPGDPTYQAFAYLGDPYAQPQFV